MVEANARQRREARKLLALANGPDGTSRVGYYYPEPIETEKTGGHRYYRAIAVMRDGRRFYYAIAACYGSYMGWFLEEV